MQAFSLLLCFCRRQSRSFPITDQLSPCLVRHVCRYRVVPTPIFFLVKKYALKLIKLGGARKTMGTG